jgi:hypothetical protein
MGDDKDSSATAPPKLPPTKKSGGGDRRGIDDDTATTAAAAAAEDEIRMDLGGFFRGVAAATRNMLPTLNPVAVKSAIRTVGQNRPLAFASEGAVAGDALLPRVVYYGAWTLSGVAIAADIYTKYEDAVPRSQAFPTALYWTCFHIPASLVVPAYIIHRVVHSVQHSVEHHTYAQSWSPRTKAFAPVVAALLSIIPVVPVVDHTAEAIMEPTLGKYLGLEFHHHHHGHTSTTPDHGGGEKKDKKE